MSRFTIIGLVVFLSAGVVLAIGLPLVIQKHSTPLPVALTDDVQAFDQLWLDLQRLQTDALELGAAQFSTRTLQTTADFLELDGNERTRFVELVHVALDDLRDAQQRMEKVNREMPHDSQARRNAWSQWQREQHDATDGLLSILQSKPRHRLLAQKRLFWLLRLSHSFHGA